MQSLEEQLKQKNRAIELMLAIDRIRDTAEDETQMTSAMIQTVADATDAELCLLCLTDDDTGEIRFRAITDRAKIYDAVTGDDLRKIAARAVASDDHTACFEFGLAAPNFRQMYGAAVPLRVGSIKLGALVLVNADRPFNPAEQELIQMAVSQMDSAMQHARTLRELRQRQKELEVIYRIDRIRDQHLEFSEMLKEVLNEVCRTIDAQTGFMMLYDQSGTELELRATTDRDLFDTMQPPSLIRQLSENALHLAKPIQCAYSEGSIRSVIGVPLILHHKLIGVLGVVNRIGRPSFTANDLQLLQAIASQTDTAIFESMQTQRLREAFGKCVGAQIMERLLTISDRDLLSSERAIITTVFSDIRGFTSMSEKIDAELLRGVLNAHLSAMTELVLDYEGTLDKYIGDGVMCFFNAPERQPDHAIRAVRLALDMQKAHRKVIADWRDQVNLPPIGIGIATGMAILGNFGSVRRLEYTAIGPNVNLAARLCGAALGDQILISETTWEMVKDAVWTDDMKPLHLKGIEETVHSRNVRGLKEGI